MSWMIPCYLALVLTAFEEGKTFAKEAEKRVDADALVFLKELYEKSHTEKNDGCSNCKQPPSQAVDVESKLQIFISFSVPLESWKDHSKYLEQTGGTFVLRGIPENSFGKLAEKIKTLREAGINAPIQIDPESYDTYHITAVPTILVEENGIYDKIVGNIHLDAALQKMADHGAISEVAANILRKIRKPSFSNVGKTQSERRS